MKSYLSLLIFLLLISPSVFANIFSTIDSVRVSGRNPTQYDYIFTIHSWDSSSTAQNPCLGQAYCNVQISHRHAIGGAGGDTTVSPQCKLTAAQGSTRVKTVGELGKLYQQVCALPRSGSTFHRSLQNLPPNFPECVGIFYTTSKSQYGEDILQPMPGSQCGISPPPVGQCGIANDNMVIDHQTVGPADIINRSSKATVGMTLTCSQNLRIQVFLKSGPTIPLGNSGISSRLTVDGVSLDTYTISLNANQPKTVTITSTLEGLGTILEGTYSGSTTLILAFP